MGLNGKNFELIEDERSLARFYEDNKSVEWLSFDTEFVGEKRYHTRLCLLQAATPQGNYIIDPLKVKNLNPFVLLLKDPSILKITHAGDNDYRLMNNLFGVVPKNIFDTQIAAGFAGYRYPISYKKIVEGETRQYLKKGFAVTDWEARPLQSKQLDYALLDVLPLYDVWKSLSKKLAENNRSHWAKEEFLRWESEVYYEKNIYQEALKSNLMKALDQAERLFLLRLLVWRTSTAQEKDYSKEMILQSKQISQIVRSIPRGYEGLKQNRHISDRLVKRHGQRFSEFYSRPINAEESAVLKKIKKDDLLTDQEEIMIELLYLLVRQKCLDAAVSPALVLSKNMLKKMKSDQATRNVLENSNWKKELLGEELVHWLLHPHKLETKIKGAEIRIELK